MRRDYIRIYGIYYSIFTFTITTNAILFEKKKILVVLNVPNYG